MKKFFLIYISIILLFQTSCGTNTGNIDNSFCKSDYEKEVTNEYEYKIKGLDKREEIVNLDSILVYSKYHFNDGTGVWPKWNEDPTVDSMQHIADSIRFRGVNTENIYTIINYAIKPHDEDGAEGIYHEFGYAFLEDSLLFDLMCEVETAIPMKYKYNYLRFLDISLDEVLIDICYENGYWYDSYNELDKQFRNLESIESFRNSVKLLRNCMVHNPTSLFKNLKKIKGQELNTSEKDSLTCMLEIFCSLTLTNLG